MKYNKYNYFITSINEKQLLKLKSIKCYRLVTDMNKSIIEPPLFLNERYQVRNFDIFMETLYTTDCKHQSTRLTSTYMVTFQTTGYLWNK